MSVPVILFILLVAALGISYLLIKRYPFELSPEGLAEQEALQQAVDEAAVEQPKRGRGRPRKTPVV